MYRLGQLVNGEWIAYSHQRLYERKDYIVAGVPGSDPGVFERLVRCMAPPYYLLYVLHTPRGEAPPGRYQSPALSEAEVSGFIERFGSFLRADGRFDLWAHSPSENATLVWDRHDQIFGYGPLDRFSGALEEAGFSVGSPNVPAPHEHHYRVECDHLAKQIMGALDWSFSPLQPADEQ